MSNQHPAAVPTNETNSDDESSFTRGLLIFDASKVGAWSSSAHRLPPTYVGVRRVRPSSRTVQRALHGDTANITAPNVVYKVMTEEGTERRMTNAEKKQKKMELRLQQKQQRKQQQLLQRTQQQQQAKCPSSKSGLKHDDDDTSYLPVPIHPSALQQELADLQGLREGVPPVLVAPAMGHAVTETATTTIWDDNLAATWAAQLKQHLGAAETVRRNEQGLRSMPYQLNPQVWTRQRPKLEKQKEQQQQESSVRDVDNDSSSWTCRIRPRVIPFDDDLAAVVHLLHTHTSCHVACGSKFGCDVLLYPGPRQNHHAVAGVRVLVHGSVLPSAYELAGYVRCLNTAGKLALVATVVRDDDNKNVVRVAMVDLALEKVIETAASGRRKRPRQQKGTNPKSLD